MPPTDNQAKRLLNDDQRQAASIKASISTYVATAALAVLAGSLALFTYISQNFAPPWTFYALMVLAAASLVISIVIGGDGQAQIVARVAHSTWTNKAVWQFNWQAILTLAALLSVSAATAIGATARRSASPTDCVSYLVQLDSLAEDDQTNHLIESIISQDPKTRACGISEHLGALLQALGRR